MAVVAGATRGAGRGIAAALGEAGATVVCTGRSSSGNPLPSDYDRPETIEETAELVTGLGGTGVPIAVDHLDSDQVASAGRPDPERATATSTCWSTTSGAPRCSRAARPTGTRRSGSTTSTTGLRILRLAIETHLVTSHHLLPLLVDRPGGLLVEVTDGTAEYNAIAATGSRCSTTWPRWR